MRKPYAAGRGPSVPGNGLLDGLLFEVGFGFMHGFEFYGEAFARWLEEQAGRPIRYEKVEPGDERVLADREQRELDAVPSRLDQGV